MLGRLAGLTLDDGTDLPALAEVRSLADDLSRRIQREALPVALREYVELSDGSHPLCHLVRLVETVDATPDERAESLIEVASLGREVAHAARSRRLVVGGARPESAGCAETPPAPAPIVPTAEEMDAAAPSGETIGGERPDLRPATEGRAVESPTDAPASAARRAERGDPPAAPSRAGGDHSRVGARRPAIRFRPGADRPPRRQGSLPRRRGPRAARRVGGPGSGAGEPRPQDLARLGRRPVGGRSRPDRSGPGGGGRIYFSGIGNSARRIVPGRPARLRGVRGEPLDQLGGSVRGGPLDRFQLRDGIDESVARFAGPAGAAATLREGRRGARFGSALRGRGCRVPGGVALRTFPARVGDRPEPGNPPRGLDPRRDHRRRADLEARRGPGSGSTVRRALAERGPDGAVDRIRRLSTRTAQEGAQGLDGHGRTGHRATAGRAAGRPALRDGTDARAVDGQAPGAARGVPTLDHPALLGRGAREAHPLPRGLERVHGGSQGVLRIPLQRRGSRIPARPPNREAADRPALGAIRDDRRSRGRQVWRAQPDGPDGAGDLRRSRGDRGAGRSGPGGVGGQAGHDRAYGPGGGRQPRRWGASGRLGRERLPRAGAEAPGRGGRRRRAAGGGADRRRPRGAPGVGLGGAPGGGRRDRRRVCGRGVGLPLRRGGRRARRRRPAPGGAARSGRRDGGSVRSAAGGDVAGPARTPRAPGQAPLGPPSGPGPGATSIDSGTRPRSASTG